MKQEAPAAQMRYPAAGGNSTTGQRGGAYYLHAPGQIALTSSRSTHIWDVVLTTRGVKRVTQGDAEPCKILRGAICAASPCPRRARAGFAADTAGRLSGRLVSISAPAASWARGSTGRNARLPAREPAHVRRSVGAEGLTVYDRSSTASYSG